MAKQGFIEKFNEWYSRQIPFVFAIDFECNRFLIYREKEAFEHGIYISMNEPSTNDNFVKKDLKLKLDYPVGFEVFNEKFRQVQRHLHNGDTYLLNLTFKTPVELNVDLKTIYEQTRAPYKIYYRNKFVCFSPEAFVITHLGYVSTFPMKGTMDAGLPGAEKILLENKKEQYEHNTVVDLLRNDLSMIAQDVEVKRYRYVEKIHTGSRRLLQASSEITGKLKKEWYENPGQLLLEMLPAGSVSGAPKKKTVEIIKNVEGENRGFYTGIFGKFDGKEIVSAVAIRFIEKNNGKYFYRSGGGITALSDPKEEYEEYLKKIYIPAF